MTRGGPRKGAGRPPTKGEKRTASLAGVHVKPSRLAAWKDAATANGIRLSRYIEMAMDVTFAEQQGRPPFAAFDALYRAHESLDLDSIYAEYVKKTTRK